MSYKAKRDDSAIRADSYLPCRWCGTATPTETLSSLGSLCVGCYATHCRKPLPECHAPQHAFGSRPAQIARDNLLAIQRVRTLTGAQRALLAAVEQKLAPPAELTDTQAP